MPVRLRLDCAYDGAAFHGWATQPGVRTVQGDLEAALATALRVSAVPVTCAGRTDTGVHARGQVVHVDVDPEVLSAASERSADSPLTGLVRRVNGILPEDVRILRATKAPPDFDARFGAVWRRYVYRIADTPEAVDPLARHQVLSWARQLDEAAMQEAAAGLIGEHDFAAYCRRREGATTVRALLELQWRRTGSGLLECTVRADAFCHHMVRGLVGGLIAVGEGRRTTDWPREVLDAGARNPGLRVAPPHGLTLEEVGYAADAELAERAAMTRRVRVRG